MNINEFDRKINQKLPANGRGDEERVGKGERIIIFCIFYAVESTVSTIRSPIITIITVATAIGQIAIVMVIFVDVRMSIYSQRSPSIGRSKHSLFPLLHPSLSRCLSLYLSPPHHSSFSLSQSIYCRRQQSFPWSILPKP